MFFTIDPSNGLAIYDQIVRQIKFAVANSALPAGALVPSVRELAGRLAVNPNTVARAYRELQAEGMLATIRGTGLEVTPQAPQRCREEREELIRQRLRSVLAEAVQSRLAKRELQQLIGEELARLAESGETETAGGRG